MCLLYRIGSRAVAIGGGTLMFLGGPAGIVIGGILMSGGISGELATI